MKPTIFLFILSITIISMLIISGCGEPPECKTNLDCKVSGSCVDSYSCNDGTCRTNFKDNCCGNGQPENIEDGKVGNSCTCPQDWGKCKINASMDSSYFESSCVNDVCATDVKEDLVTVEKINKVVNLKAFDVSMNVQFDKPFNIKHSEFGIELELTNKLETTFEPKITNIQLVSMIGRTQVVLAEKELNKVLWSVGSKIDENLFVTYKPEKSNIDLPLSVVISYEYTKKVAGRDNQIVRDSKTIRVKESRDKLTFLMPTREYFCDDCDDGNVGTIDSCVEGTGFCEHKPKPNTCGNFICDSRIGENSCTCPNDCGPCSGVVGNYLSLGCNADNKCVAQLNTAADAKTFIKEAKTNYFTTNVYLTMNQPFDVNNDMVNVRFELVDENENLVEPITIEKINIIGSGSELLGESVLTSGNTLNAILGEVQVNIPLDSIIMESLEEENALSYTVYYSYRIQTKDGPSEIKRGTFEDKLSDVVFVKLG